ncbi:THAP domain-containing protein 8 [Galemys pyrenaicus]|uniref:THAP domain-containing protein 8 n=1 Tax=Galemys pyrenaicus TaxID=202257 RepID=A0A8J6AMK0_GALPY|nr:THAP domain-containing protein 8 [Galemys pyrenaicus]
MPKYCRAPNCSNTAGRLGADNRPVSFYKFPLKDGPRLQAWLRHMGREHWVPSCHQHLCSEHFTPSCFQWRWGVRYLRPDAVPSIFSPGPTKREHSSGSKEKLLVPPPPQEATPLPPSPDNPHQGPVHLVVLGPASGDPEAKATVFLTPRPLPTVPPGPPPGVPSQHPRARLGTVLGALQRRVRRLQRRQERHQAQLRALEQLAQQLRWESLLARARRGQLHGLPGPEESRSFTIICGGPDVAVVLAQGPVAPALDAKAELLDAQALRAPGP